MLVGDDGVCGAEESDEFGPDGGPVASLVLDVPGDAHAVDECVVLRGGEDDDAVGVVRIPPSFKASDRVGGRTLGDIPEPSTGDRFFGFLHSSSSTSGNPAVAALIASSWLIAKKVPGLARSVSREKNSRKLQNTSLSPFAC